MSNYPHIGFDLDGTIIDHSQNILQLADGFGISLNLNDTPSEVFKDKVDKDLYLRIRDSVYGDYEVAKSSNIFNGFINILHELSHKKVKFYIVSCRKTKESRLVAKKFLQLNDLWPKYFNDNNVSFVDKERYKAEYIQKHDIGIYIDDKPSVLHMIDVDVRKYLFDPMNVYLESDEYVRIRSWDEFEIKVEDISSL